VMIGRSPRAASTGGENTRDAVTGVPTAFGSSSGQPYSIAKSVNFGWRSFSLRDLTHSNAETQSDPRCILACIDVGKRLAVGVTDFESARYRLNGPGWLEIDALVSFLVGRASGDWFPCYDYANAHHSLSTCGVGATRRSGACVRGL
jgi:hypothetical protein